MATQSDLYLSYFEAENLVQSLKEFEIKDVGSIKWLKQHEILEKLNIQVYLLF